MALSSKMMVDLPDKGVIVRRRGAYRYVYKVTETYRNGRGQPTNRRISIGRLDEASGRLIPNDSYFAHYGGGVDVLPAYDSIRSVGAEFLVAGILGRLGIGGILAGCLGEARARRVETVCAYMVGRGNVMEHLLGWCEGYTLRAEPMTSQSASALFASIGHAETMAFFRAWVAAQAPVTHLAYDVTSLSSYSEGVTDTEWGHNRDGERLPQVNLGCYLSEQSGLPLFYVTYPGSIVDKSHLGYMMAYNGELGIEGVTFVMDRGFCSTANVKYMRGRGLPFILGVENRHKTVRAAIDSVRDGIVSMANRADGHTYAASARGVFYGVAADMHVYYDAAAAERQRRDLYRMVEAMGEELAQMGPVTGREARRFRRYFDIDIGEGGAFSYRLDHARVDGAARDNGFFCLLTDTGCGSAELLDAYRRKDAIEKGFDDLKNHLDMGRLRTHGDETTAGKLFCAFVALIAAMELTRGLNACEATRGTTKKEAIYEMEKARCVTAPGGQRLMNPLTRRQKDILAAFGWGEDEIKDYIVASR